MLKGCLLLVVALAAALFFEHRFISQQDLPEPWVAIGVLSVLVMLLVGSIHGLLAAFAKRLNPETDPSSWKDGQEVRISGTILPQRQAIRAPFSGADSVLFRYRMWQSLEMGRETLDERNDPSVNGIEMVPCSLLTTTGSWELRGFPPLRRIPINSYSGETHYPQAARLLATTPWRITNPSEAARMLGDALRGDAFQPPQHVMNQTARERLLAPPGQPAAGTWQGGPPRQLSGEDAVTVLCQRMAARAWSFEEQHIPAGAQVTVEGTYSASPPSINMGQAISKPGHSISLGLAAETASREWVQAFVFVTVLTVIVTVLHYAVYANQGELYRFVMQELFP
jgi:hypothetical protein